MAILEERFSTAYFRFNDNTAAELQPGFRAPEDAQEFIARWDETARNLAQTDAMRLLGDFQRDASHRGWQRPQEITGCREPQIPMIVSCTPGCRETSLASSTYSYDSTAGEQVEAGQTKTAEDGTRLLRRLDFIFDRKRWTSVVRKARYKLFRQRPNLRKIRFRCASYVIDAHVKPPKQLDAEVKLQSRRGARGIALPGVRAIALSEDSDRGSRTEDPWNSSRIRR